MPFRKLLRFSIYLDFKWQPSVRTRSNLRSPHPGHFDLSIHQVNTNPIEVSETVHMGSMDLPSPFVCTKAVEHRAAKDPDRAWVLMPKTDNLQEGYFIVTYVQLANAVDKVSWWLDENLPPQNKTLIYQGPNDVRWAFILFAAQKTRREFLVLNPNNSLDADMKLIGHTHGQKILVADEFASRFETWRRQRSDLESVTFPSLNHWLAEAPTRRYHYEAPSTAQEALKTPWLIMHTSGTTGQPKPINFTVGYQDVMFRQRQAWERGVMGPENVWQRLSSQKTLLPFPQTWSAGLAIIADLAIVWEHIPVLYPPNAPHPLSARTIADSVRYSGATSAILIPFILKQLSQEPEHFAILKSAGLDLVGYAGAPLDDETRALLEPHIRVLQPMYGAADVGNVPVYTSAPGDSNYIGLSPQMGYTFEPVPEAGDDVHELVLKKANDKEGLVYLFQVQPDVKEFFVRDLFVRHPDPSKADFWRHVGRKDDFMKNHLLTKTSASQVEALVEQARFVRGSCFVQIEGRSGSTNCLLVEVEDHLRKEKRDDEIMRLLWPKIESANEQLSDEIRLLKRNVVVVPQDMPLPRLGKGTVNRRAVPDLYAEHFKSLNA